ncbi:hypothetical protein Rmet_6623 (plasmid) [Cupriavidus metallidurans CH34]|uniref:Uncharacterized protein n=1 Tax=Cupriavidus metallidurans (strain ATCC 43123 / DSM 2839 / NBRC 102507 / CH34) TaxID=266264 RepID=D3DY53_CUPMC|nr:hypothetical protein Rmet_6623 [Cupriavidus metallidurans CH34]
MVANATRLHHLEEENDEPIQQDLPPETGVPHKQPYEQSYKLPYTPTVSPGKLAPPCTARSA